MTSHRASTNCSSCNDEAFFNTKEIPLPRAVLLMIGIGVHESGNRRTRRFPSPISLRPARSFCLPLSVASLRISFARFTVTLPEL
jgi:hypothetical protein